MHAFEARSRWVNLFDPSGPIGTSTQEAQARCRGPDRARVCVDRGGSLHAYGGLIEAADRESAFDLVLEGEARLGEMEPCQPCSMLFHVEAVKVSAERDAERAQEHLDAAARIATMWRGGAWHAAVSEARAMLLAADGHVGSEVEALLQEAAAQFEAAGRYRDAARCRAADHSAT